MHCPIPAHSKHLINVSSCSLSSHFTEKGIEVHRGEVIGSVKQLSHGRDKRHIFWSTKSFSITWETWDVGMTLDLNSNRFTNNFLLWEDSNVQKSREDSIMSPMYPWLSSNNCQRFVTLFAYIALYVSPLPSPPEYLRLILNILSNSNCIFHGTLFHVFHL